MRHTAAASSSRRPTPRHDRRDWRRRAARLARRRRRAAAGTARPTASTAHVGSHAWPDDRSSRPAASQRARSATRGAHGGADVAPRTGAKRTVIYYMKQLPAYLRLLGGLLTDRRVATVDKLLVAGAIAYIVMPIDFIPGLHSVPRRSGRRLPARDRAAAAGRERGAPVLLAHWTGAMEDLADLNLQGSARRRGVLPSPQIRRRLKMIGRG